MRWKKLDNGLYEDVETGAVGQIRPGRGGGYYLDTNVEGGSKGEKKAEKKEDKKVYQRSQMEEYSSRPNQDKLIDMVDEGLINYEDATLMAFKYNSIDDIKSAMRTLGYDTEDINSVDDIYDDDIDAIGEELLAEMSDDDIGDMMRVNGIENEEVEDTNSKEEIYNKLYDMNKVQAIDYVDKLYGEDKIDTDTYEELKDFVGVNENLTGDEVLNTNSNNEPEPKDEKTLRKERNDMLNNKEIYGAIQDVFGTGYALGVVDETSNLDEAKQYILNDINDEMSYSGTDDETKQKYQRLKDLINNYGKTYEQEQKSKPYSYLDDDDIDRDFPELSKKVTDKFNASLQQAANELGYDVNTNDGKEYMEISNRAKEIRENEKFGGSNLKEEKSQREAKFKDSYNAWQKHYDKSDWNNDEWRNENDRLYKEMDQNRSDYNEFFKDYVNKVDDSQLTWQDKIGKLQLERNDKLSKMNPAYESDKYYGTYAEYEKKFADIRSQDPNELYEPVDSYYSYKEKRDRLTNVQYDDAGNLVDWNSDAKWTGKEYTNDEFFEHLEDANWHSERRLLELAGLTNQEMEYIKNNTTLMDASVGPELTGKENVQKMIDEAKAVSKRSQNDELKTIQKSFSDKPNKIDYENNLREQKTELAARNLGININDGISKDELLRIIKEIEKLK